jgi:hypothetical protein
MRKIVKKTGSVYIMRRGYTLKPTQARFAYFRHFLLEPFKRAPQRQRLERVDLAISCMVF